MPITITSEFLFLKLAEERSKGELSPLPKDFYLEASKFIESMASGDSDTKQVLNVQKILRDIREKRRQKLVVYLAYNRPLPQPFPAEEEALYNEIRRILNETAESNAGTARLRILSDIPEILTTEGRKIGPYKQGEVIEISAGADAEFMLKNKIGELVSQ